MSGNTIVYTAGTGVANSVWVGPSLMNQGELIITETVEEITAVPDGWTLSLDNHTATGPFDANSMLRIDVLNESDYVDARLSPVAVNINGMEGNDTLYGSAYNDQILGGDG